MSETTHPGLAVGPRLPNVWDVAAFVCVLGLVVALVSVGQRTGEPLAALDTPGISLDPTNLPGYAARTTLRMFAALAASLVFTFTFATAAAKSRRAGIILVPILDILQSVPILGFLTFTTVFFMGLFPGRVAGLELAVIFAIFTSQAWNMAFSLYQALKTVPADLKEASLSLHQSGWQRFWRLEAPFGVPGLIWNMLMSMSGGWFMIVASEAISVGDANYKLPGIGSYIALAEEKGDLAAVGYAILTMAVVILLYDQALFRPLVAWSDKFRFETTAAVQVQDPWMLRLIRKTRLLRVAGERVSRGAGWLTGQSFRIGRARAEAAERRPSRAGDFAFYVLLAVAVGWIAWHIVDYVREALTPGDLTTAIGLGAITLLRVSVLMVIATLVWVPVGVYVGLRPAWARRAQPVAQFLAAFPANLFYPIFVAAIVRWSLDVDVWLTPLMVLGTQWYILFNVIAGASAFPSDLREAAANFRVGGWLWWRRVIIPGIFSYYVTGAITASGGSWNAAILAEVVQWRDTKLTAHGLGAYIADSTAAGDLHRVVLGVAVMSGYVLLFNRLVWRNLYGYAERRLNFG